MKILCLDDEELALKMLQMAVEKAKPDAEVLGFDEGQVILMTDNGEIALTGEGLHVTRLMLEEGQLAVEGKIDSVFYTQRARRRGLFRSKNK